MKWIFRLLTLGSVCFALALPFFIKDGSGTAMWSLPLLGNDSTPTLIKVDKVPEKEVVRQVYKWKDAEGVWQYSDEPPPEGTQVSTLTVSNKTNVIQSFKPPTAETDADGNGTQPAANISEQARKTLEEAADQDTLSLERAMNIMNEAKAVRELMNARNQQLQNLSGDTE